MLWIFSYNQQTILILEVNVCAWAECLHLSLPTNCSSHLPDKLSFLSPSFLYSFSSFSLSSPLLLAPPTATNALYWPFLWPQML